MAEPAARVSGPLRRLGASLFALGRIRLELLAIEIQEEKERVAEFLLWSVLTGLMLGFGAVFVALFVTVALWDTYRLPALGVSALLFVSLAAVGVVRLRRLARGGGSVPFQSSIAEMREDSAALRGDPPR